MYTLLGRLSHKCLPRTLHSDGIRKLATVPRVHSRATCRGFQRTIHTSCALLNKNYYKILGVDKKAPAADIKKAYYQLAKKHHPDVAKDGDSPDRFKDISEAYEVLSDDQKRSEYDLYGSDGGQQNAYGGRSSPFGNANYSYSYQTKVNPEELFRQAFGGNFDFDSIFGDQSSRAQSQPRNRYQMNLSFLDAANGVTRNVQLSYPITCQRCQGRKGEPGSGLRNCHRCKGTGHVISQVGWYHVQQECSTCNGIGQIITQKCKECYGKGSTSVTEDAEINIPSGVEDGTAVRYRTKGGVDIGITIQVEKSSLFRRSDMDIVSSVDIDMVKAILGGTHKITGIKGKLDVKIPPNTQPGSTLRLVGKGIVDNVSHRGVGNHILNISVTLPKNLTYKQRLLLAAFDDRIESADELIRELGGTPAQQVAQPDPKPEHPHTTSTKRDTDTKKQHSDTKKQHSDTKKPHSDTKPEDDIIHPEVEAEKKEEKAGEIFPTYATYVLLATFSLYLIYVFKRSGNGTRRVDDDDYKGR